MKGKYEELDGGFASSPTNKKKILFISVTTLVIVGFVLGLSLGLVLRSKSSDDENNNPSPKLYGFEDIFDPSLTPRYASLEWTYEGGNYTRVIDGNIYLNSGNVNEPSGQLLLNASSLLDENGNKITFSSYSLSPDQKLILLATQYQKIWRHSFSAVYLIYEISSGTVYNLTNVTYPPITNVQWSPSTQRSSVAFVRDNNLFIKEIDLKIPKPEIQVTFDGKENSIINGFTSWVYEEEIFSDYNAVWWSPDASKLAYLKFNETDVPEFEFPYYTGAAYPTEIKIKYPKAGKKNPTVQLFLYDIALKTSTLQAIPVPDFEYIGEVVWDQRDLYVQVLNRFQNQVTILKYTNSSQPYIFANLNDSNWLDLQPLFFPAGTDYALIIQKAPNGFNHIAKYNKTTSKFEGFVTQGDWQVVSISGYYQPEGILFFISTQTSSLERDLFGIQLNGKDLQRKTFGGWNTAKFSANGEYFWVNHGGPGFPYDAVNCISDGVSIIIQQNYDMQKALDTFQLPSKEFITLQIETGEVLNGYLLKPPSFDSSRKYPVLMNVYGGPGSQLVSQQFDKVGFHTYVASTLGYIVACFDGRGTGFQSDKFTKQVYLNLGHLEALDQISAATYLSTLSYVDSNRIGIWGWSYGGYMTLKTLTYDSTHLLSFGISVAPVTSWEFYDSVYTERYMRTPETNPDGYTLASVLPNVTNIRDDQLFLIHGTGDDNVHFQNSAELAKVLIEKNIQFKTMFYPNYDHGIRARRHLYRMMAEFLNGGVFNPGQN